MLTELHQIKTKDGLLLEGLLYQPKRRRGRAAAIWIGGLSSRFSNNPTRTQTLAAVLNRNGIGFAAFDHRGLGTVNRLHQKRRGRKSRSFLAGTTFEKFEHCVFDIDAVIRFLRKRGYRRIFLLGQSTGANKSAYCAWKKDCRGIAGIGLLGPLSDIPGIRTSLGRNYPRAIAAAKSLVKRKRGNELMPLSLTNGRFFSAARFLSIAEEGRREDTFPYYNPRRHFYWTRRLRVPVLVLIGSKDQYADRPVAKILGVFRREIPPRWFTGILLKGANHNFSRRESELARAVMRWITRSV